MPSSAAPAKPVHLSCKDPSPCLIRCLKLPCRSSRSASTRFRACSTRPRPSPRRRKSTPRCCSAAGSRPTCSRSPARCRSPATRPRTARRGSPASSRRNSRTTKRRLDQLKARIAKTVAFLKTLDAQGDRRLGRPRDHLSARPEQGPDEGRRLPQSLRAAEFLFPPHRRLRHRAPLRRRGRQARLPRRHSDQAHLRAQRTKKAAPPANGGAALSCPAAI